MKAIKYIWVSSCLGVLILSSYFNYKFGTSENVHEIAFFMLIAMGVLTFPLGGVAGYLFIAIVKHFSSTCMADCESDGSPLILLFVFWFIMSAFGYFQWFKLFPFIIKNLGVKSKLRYKFKKKGTLIETGD